MNVAEIGGLVIDPAGEVIPGAMVTATNTATGLKATVTSGPAGEYRLSQLAPGVYSIDATAPGFKQAILENVVVHAGERMDLKFSMVLGERAETLVVEEFPATLQTESAQITDVIENRQVNDLPVKDREFLQLALLGSGVVNPPGGTRGDSLQQTGQLINILGQRTGHNLFLVDGVSVTDEYYNNVVLNPPPDAIREFNIAKTNYDAEFGGKSGGVINVITQAGTNSFHGSLYEFLRNSVFDARNFFAPPNRATPFQENQFGVSAGRSPRERQDVLLSGLRRAEDPGFGVAPIQRSHRRAARGSIRHEHRESGRRRALSEQHDQRAARCRRRGHAGESSAAESSRRRQQSSGRRETDQRQQSIQRADRSPVFGEGFRLCAGFGIHRERIRSLRFQRAQRSAPAGVREEPDDAFAERVSG